MTIFTIPMGGLVKVHEIHIDRIIRNFLIKLGVKVHKGFLYSCKPKIQDFAGESMHP
jgi:hypothetical protein